MSHDIIDELIFTTKYSVLFVKSCTLKKENEIYIIHAFSFLYTIVSFGSRVLAQSHAIRQSPHSLPRYYGYHCYWMLFL